MITLVVVAVLVAATALLIRIILPKEHQPVDVVIGSSEKREESLVPMESFVPEVLPPQWDSQVITQQITALQRRPSVLAHYINSVMNRFITGQDDKTAQKRTDLIITATKQLEANLDLQIALDNLQIHFLDRQIKIIKKEIELTSAKDLVANQKRLDSLEQRKKELEIEVVIAKLEQEKNSYTQPKPSEPTKPTREDLRKRKQEEIDRKHRESAEDIFRVTNGRAFDDLTSEEQDRVMRLQNYYNDQKARLVQELADI
jgi:hypothetical protein